MAISPTSRTLKYLRTQGYQAGIVERFNPYARIRQDLFHFIDIIALAEHSILAVQSCGQAFAEHNRKILNEPLALEWLKSGGRIMLIGWRKILRNRKGKLKVWSPRIKKYSLKDFK